MPREPIRRETARNWFLKAARLAGVKHRAGLGLHTFKRKAATELDDAPMHTVSELLGTRAQTLMKVYQQPNEHRQREALAARGPSNRQPVPDNGQYERTVPPKEGTRNPRLRC